MSAKRVAIVLGIVFVLLLFCAMLIVRQGVKVLSSSLYPPAPPMPPVASASADELLAKYEQLLVDQAPKILEVLQPGLSDREIDELESKYNIKLTADLRALYRWRNGAPREAAIDVFPNHEFIPLDRALANRDDLWRQIGKESLIQRWAFQTFAGHREKWTEIIVDLAGDGYFFDPERSEAEGSFFFNFAEDGSYVFFPAFRNYLAAVLEGNESGVFTFGDRGAETTDFERAQTLWQKHGAENVR